jgi:hypothetical protein
MRVGLNWHGIQPRKPLWAPFERGEARQARARRRVGELHHVHQPCAALREQGPASRFSCCGATSGDCRFELRSWTLWVSTFPSNRESNKDYLVEDISLIFPSSGHNPISAPRRNTTHASFLGRAMRCLGALCAAQSVQVVQAKSVVGSEQDRHVNWQVVRLGGSKRQVIADGK